LNPVSVQFKLRTQVKKNGGIPYSDVPTPICVYLRLGNPLKDANNGFYLCPLPM